MTPRIVGDDALRFEGKVNRTNSCWLWTGALSANGYGYFAVAINGKRQQHTAHRYSYERHVGPVPDGLDLDHPCRVRHCVNPAHLEPVTRRENVQRGLRGPQPFCVHGHALEGDNVITRKNGRHECRTCENARQRLKSARRKGEKVDRVREGPR